MTIVISLHNEIKSRVANIYPPGHIDQKWIDDKIAVEKMQADGMEGVKRVIGNYDGRVRKVQKTEGGRNSGRRE
jgi:hypothetical protein